MTQCLKGRDSLIADAQLVQTEPVRKLAFQVTHFKGLGLTLEHLNVCTVRPTNRGVFPVEDDFWNAVCLLHLGVLAPVCTANCYHSICVHAKIQKLESYSIITLCYNPRLQAIYDVNEIPFQGLFCMLWRNVHAKVPKGLHEFPEINTA